MQQNKAIIEQLHEALAHPNVQAFLTMIRHCEGTDGPNGYRTMFGGELFDSFANHPKKFFDYTDKSGKTVKTSAAGAYQITWTTWKTLKERLVLKDFSQESQDLAAVELIRESLALVQIQGGYFTDAINRVRKIWASLPGSGCNQPEKSLAAAKQYYENAGGKMA